MIYISAVGMINALGDNCDEIAANLTRGIAPGMRPRPGWLEGQPAAVLGGVDAVLPAIADDFAAHRSRNNQLLLAALTQIRPQVDEAIARFGSDRVAVVLGTSTSGLDEGDIHVAATLNGGTSAGWQYPQQELGDPSRFDYIFTVGGLIEGGPGLTPEQTGFLRRAAQGRVPLGGLCTGVFALARLGLMDGYRCCVSWFHHQDFLAEFEKMRPVSDQIFVVDRDRLSCSGGVSAAHLAAFLVDRHIGRAAARKSLSILMIDEPMQGDRPQPGLPLELNARDPLVRRALLAMQQNLQAPLPIARIARDLGVGRRKLERHFNADLGVPPADASIRIRLAQARMLLSRSDRTVTRIAEETGFCDASHLIRVFRESQGITPDQWRQQALAGQDVPSSAIPELAAR